MNGWSYTFTPPYAFMVCTQATLLLNLMNSLTDPNKVPFVTTYSLLHATLFSEQNDLILQRSFKKIKVSRYRPGVTQRVGRCIALLFHDRSTRRRWVVSSTPQPHFTPRKDLLPILQEAGWTPGPVWMGGKCGPHRDSIPDLPAHSSVAIPTELPSPLQR